MGRTAVIGLVMLAWAAGCGDGAPAGPPPLKGDPALGRDEPAQGEIVVRGELSPASRGPHRFDGEYTVRFEQQAPEDPGLDFTRQTAFVATLDTAAEIKGSDSVRLFRTSRRTGRKRIELHGRFFVDVSFGDFPWVIRFTPH